MLTQLPAVNVVEAIDLTSTTARPGPLEKWTLSNDLFGSGVDDALLTEHGQSFWVRAHARLAWDILHLDTFQNLMVSCRESQVLERATLAFEHDLPVAVIVSGEMTVTFDELAAAENDPDDSKILYGLFTLLEGRICQDPYDGYQVVLEIPDVRTVRLPPMAAQAVLIKVADNWYGHL